MSSHICNFSKDALGKHPLPMALSRAFHRQMQFTWTKFCSLILQIEKMDWLNYQLPAGKQPITATLFQAHYECHLQRWSPSERNLCFISIKRSKEHWPGPRGPPWSPGITADLWAPTHFTYDTTIHSCVEYSIIPIPKCKVRKYQMNSVS